MESQHPVHGPSTASKCCSDLTRSRPPSASPNSLDHGVHVYLQTRSITASKFAQSWTPSASPNSVDHDSLQVYLQTRSIMASMFAQSWPLGASPNSLDYGLQVHISILARSRPPSLHEHGLPVHLLTRKITITECISKFT